VRFRGFATVWKRGSMVGFPKELAEQLGLSGYQMVAVFTDDERGLIILKPIKEVSLSEKGEVVGR